MTAPGDRHPIQTGACRRARHALVSAPTPAPAVEREPTQLLQKTGFEVVEWHLQGAPAIDFFFAAHLQLNAIAPAKDPLVTTIVFREVPASYLGLIVAYVRLASRSCCRATRKATAEHHVRRKSEPMVTAPHFSLRSFHNQAPAARLRYTALWDEQGRPATNQWPDRLGPVTVSLTLEWYGRSQRP